MTLGSLFDGSGGFPLAAALVGIEPRWASEIEPFPIAVTRSRFPDMKHLGDICRINGAEIEPVDIITFGSPCQDLSVAGNRAGLDGARSGLFMEAVRIIKEMREATNGKYPRYALWENVPGAFSSNRGEDFRTVLEELIKLAEPAAVMPPVPPGGWAYADCYVGDRWSLAYRVFDAQYWGVPQRRRRIHLVCDFAGHRAGEVLFKREGLRGNFAASFRAWQRTAGGAAPCAGAAGFDGYNGSLTGNVASTIGVNCGMSTGRNGVVLNDQGGGRMDVTTDVAATLRAEAHGHLPCVLASAGFCTEHSAKSRSIGYEEETSPTLRADVVSAAVALEQQVYENHSQDTRYTGPLDTAPTVSATYGMGGNNQPFVVSEETSKTLKIRSGCEGCGKGALIQENKSATLSCNNDQTLFEPCNWDGQQTAPTLTAHNAGGGQRMPDKNHFNCVLQAYGRDTFNQGKNAKFAPTFEPELQPTLVAKGPGAIQSGYTVRRLTPTECARLQGFPDWWCTGLETEEPTETDIAFWTEVWETHRRIVSPSAKPKTEKQIVKWLRDPHSDSAEYKMWGNGIALPPALYCMEGFIDEY